jgi:hypothetical protein
MTRSVPLASLVFALLLLAVTGCVAADRAVEATPPDAGYTFPPEWAPHEAVWLAWSGTARLHPLQVEMIRAMAPHVRIRLMVTSDKAGVEATAALDAAGIGRERVELVTHEVPNFWIRDAAPRFLSDGRRLALADFAWNGYGYPRELLVSMPDLPCRAVVVRDLAARLKLPLVSSAVVSEGGALDVRDAVIVAYRGTALQRNPGVPLPEIEREYLRVYGKKKVVWLDRFAHRGPGLLRAEARELLRWGRQRPHRRVRPLRRQLDPRDRPDRSRARPGPGQQGGPRDPQREPRPAPKRHERGRSAVPCDPAARARVAPPPVDGSLAGGAEAPGLAQGVVTASRWGTRSTGCLP